MTTTSEEILVDAALKALGKIPSLSITIDHTSSANTQDHSGVDTYLYVRAGSDRGQQSYRVEVKRRITSDSLEAVLERHQQPDSPDSKLLLVTEQAGETLVDRLLDQNAEFVDAAGNMFLTGPGYYVLVRGRSLPRKSFSQTRTLTATSLKVIYALLAFPELRRGTYRDIRDVLDVGLASISRTVNSLLAQGYLVRGQDDALHIIRYDDLLYRWELGYLETLRAKLDPTPWRFTKLGKEEILASLRDRDDVLVGGEEAASILTGRLKPQTLTLHVSPAVWRTLRVVLRVLPANEETDLYVLHPLTTHDRYHSETNGDNLPVAHPILVRAELLALGGDRLRDVATELLGSIIRSEFAND